MKNSVPRPPERSASWTAPPKGTTRSARPCAVSAASRPSCVSGVSARRTAWTASSRDRSSLPAVVESAASRFASAISEARCASRWARTARTVATSATTSTAASPDRQPSGPVPGRGLAVGTFLGGGQLRVRRLPGGIEELLLQRRDLGTRSTGPVEGCRQPGAPVELVVRPTAGLPLARGRGQVPAHRAARGVVLEPPGSAGARRSAAPRARPRDWCRPRPAGAGRRRPPPPGGAPPRARPRGPARRAAPADGPAHRPRRCRPAGRTTAARDPGRPRPAPRRPPPRTGSARPTTPPVSR